MISGVTISLGMLLFIAWVFAMASIACMGWLVWVVTRPTKRKRKWVVAFAPSILWLVMCTFLLVNEGRSHWLLDLFVHDKAEAQQQTPLIMPL